MHPNPRFTERDDAVLRARVLEIGVVHLFVATPAGPMVAHVPLSAHGDDFRFHIARANRIVPYLSSASVIASAMGDNYYVSPDWYAKPTDQVPTWNYRAVEFDATCHALDRDALIAQIDALSALNEARLDKRPWTMAKVADRPRDAMLSAITAFELRVAAIRGTEKFSQNKTPADRAGVAAALTAIGHPGAATLA